MNGAELLVDVHMRQALVADLRQNPPVISVARPSNRPGTLRKGDEALSSGAAPQPQPQQLLLKSNDDEGNDHEDFFEDDVSSSARLSATASPHRGDRTNSEFGIHSQHLQTSTPHRSLGSNNCESPSPQSQRTRTAHPTVDDDVMMNRSALVVTRQQQHRTSSSGGDPPRASAAAGGVLSAPTHDLLPLPNTTARLLLRPASSSSSVNLFPVIPISETLKGLPRRLTFGSATTNRSNNGATGAPSSSTTTPPTMPSDAITKNTLALLTAPRHGVGSSSRRSNSLQMVRTKETLEQQHSQHLLQMPPPLPPASGRGSVCSDPDVEGDRGEHRGTAGSADGTARRVSSSSEQTTSQRFAGIGTSSMSGSLEKDLMITERIVKRIAEEYSEKKKKQQSLISSSAAKQKKHQQQQQRSNNNDAGETSAPSTSAKIHDSDEEDWDMFLSSVMSVSHTFQSISTAAGREPTINNAPTSSSSRFSWLNRRAALSAIHATRVPQEYWVTRDPIQQPRSTTDAAATAGNLMQALKDKVRVLAFPSTNPGNRPEVYLLARTLDQMIVDTVPDFKLLGDTTVAYAVLPAELSAGTCEDNATAIGQLYATVVRSFMQVVDVGLSEIARQIAGTCPERAALLDCMRQCCNDLHHTLLDVVEHSKRRAFEEAIRRQQYDDIISAKNRQIIDGLTKVTALEERVLTLETQLETNAMKAARFDELVSRMDLREQQRQRAIVRVDQLELLDDAEEAVSRAAMLAAAAYEDLGNAEAGTKPPESTMARIERLRQEEDERNHALLYTESVKLLKALRSSVEATDAACAPLYDRMLFSKPELNVSVASGRWASIGKALGEHEAVWDHRERVAKAHALWLEVMTTKANARLRVLPIGAVMSSAATADGVDAQQQQKTNSIREFECSVEQLRAMGIHDVTPDEIMMLQRDDFDSDHFLHPAQRIPARWGLKNAGVAQMLSDAEMTFSEITLRLEALKQSELLGDVAKPPMMPPSRPSDPCALCNRRDVVEIEKRQHKTFLDNLLRELGEREAEGQNEVKLAQEERDKAKSQLETQFEITQKLEERLAMLESQIAMQQRMGESRFDDEAVLSSLGSQQPLLEVSAASPRASAAGQQGVAANVASNRQQTQAIAVGDVLSVDGGSMNVNNNGRSSTARSSSRTDGDSPLDGKGSTTRRNSHRSSSVLSLNSGSRSPPSAPLQRTMTSSRQRSPTEQHSPPAALEKRSNRVSPMENTSTSSPARSASSLVRKASTLVKTTSMLHKKKSTLKPNSSSLNTSSSSGAPNHTLAAATAHNESVATEAFIPPTLLNSSIFLSSSLPDAPIVVQLVLNCACCGGGAGSTGAATPQHHLPLETNMLMMQDSQNVVASVVSVTDMSPPRRPATGERRKASNAGGDTVGGGAAPNATPGQQNQYQDGKESSISMFAVDKGDLSLLVLDQPGAVGATPANDDDDDEGFIAVGSQLDSFVGAADPITTHSQTVALKRQASSRVGPVERASTRAALKSSSPSSAKELSRPGSTRVAQSAVEKNVSSRLSSAGSGPGSAAIPPTGEADPFGDHVAVVDDPVADGEDAHHYHRHAEGDGDGVESPTGGGGEFRDTGSFLIPRTGQETVAQSMWTQMEGQLLHRLKSSAIRASMSADVDHHTNPAASDITKIPKPPAGSDPRKSVGGGGGDRGLSAKQQRQSAGGGGRPSIHPDEIARINSTKAINTIIDTNSTDDNLERGFKIANEKLRQNILKLSGRIESMQATSMRSSAWLLKYIGNFYRAKRLADATAENGGHAYIPAADFLLTFLKRKLGAKEVVFENMHNIYTTCRALKSSDLRIRQFMEVMFAYNNRQAAFFLQLSLALECCAVGLDYSVSHQHFALDEHATKPEVVCLRRIAAVLTETGLHKRPYAPFLWKALSHRSLAFEVDDDRFYDSLRKAGMEAEAIQRHPPSSWSEQDVSLMRVVVLKSAFLSLICGFETKLQSALLEPSSSSSALANIEAPHHPADLLLIKVAEPSPSSSPHSPAA